MDADRFDVLVRTLSRTGSRRAAFGALTGGALAAVAAPVAAKHKKKCKKPRLLCSGTCTNVQKDPLNCGHCGHACDVNESCAAGVCACTPDCAGKHCGDDGCGGSCGTCPANNCQGTTLTTEACESGACVPHLVACGSGQVCFGNACCTKRLEPACHKATVSDGCGGTYPPNCSHNCCGTGSGGALVCQTNPCP